MTTTIPSPPALTPNDNLVLFQIFSPSASLSNTNFIDSTLPSPNSGLLVAEARILAPLNTASPSDFALHTAITALDAFIKENPDYASAYNNRAQATRLLLGDDLRAKGNAWADLSQAIALAGNTRLGNKVSKHEAGVLAKAHTQRAWLVWKFAKEERAKHDRRTTQQQSDIGKAQNKPEDLESQGNAIMNFPEQLRTLTWEQLEEVASRDFEMGSRYGNKGAREMAVRTNFHAKLCGAIVREAMVREMGDKSNISNGEARLEKKEFKRAKEDILLLTQEDNKFKSRTPS